MRLFLRGSILFVFILAPVSAWATHPFLVEDTVVQGKGNYSFELDSDTTNVRNSSEKATDMRAVITAGTGPDTDLSLEVPYDMLNPSPATGRYERGTGDVQLNLKYRTYENEVNQSSGFQIYTNLPTGSLDRGLGTNNVVLGAVVMDQQECHNNILHVSAGYELITRDLKKYHFSEDSAFKFGLALERRLSGSFRLLSELAGESRKSYDRTAHEQSKSAPFTFMAGFRYDITPSWYFDLAERAGMNKYAEDNTLLLGTAWRF